MLTHFVLQALSGGGGLVDVSDMLFNEARVKTLAVGFGRPEESGGEYLCWDGVCVALMQTESYLFSKSSSSTDYEGAGWMFISSLKDC